MADLNKLAAVFDAMAVYVDSVEREKTSASVAARNARIDKIATLHAASHGEEMPDLTRKKLASADDATLDVVEELLNKQAGTITPLGEGVDADDTVPQTTKEAADDADKKFVSWIIS